MALSRFYAVLSRPIKILQDKEITGMQIISMVDKIHLHDHSIDLPLHCRTCLLESPLSEISWLGRLAGKENQYYN
jgi:hypothetical protein